MFVIDDIGIIDCEHYLCSRKTYVRKHASTVNLRFTDD